VYSIGIALECEVVTRFSVVAIANCYTSPSSVISMFGYLALLGQRARLVELVGITILPRGNLPYRYDGSVLNISRLNAFIAYQRQSI